MKIANFVCTLSTSFNLLLGQIPQYHSGALLVPCFPSIIFSNFSYHKINSSAPAFYTHEYSILYCWSWLGSFSTRADRECLQPGAFIWCISMSYKAETHILAVLWLAGKVLSLVARLYHWSWSLFQSEILHVWWSSCG